MTAHWIDFSKANNNSKPLNPIGAQLRSLILSELEIAHQSSHITHVILHGGAHHSFSAGADLTEFANLSEEQPSTTLIDVVTAIENFPKPILAAIRGRALGGGLEVALACHYRIACARAQLGLPEVKVGMIPGAGGTQRLPKLIGTKPALDMILSGKPVEAARALPLGLVDVVVEEPSQLIRVAEKWGTWAALMPLESRRVGQLSGKETPAQVQALCQVAAQKLPPSELGGEALHCALQALQASSLPLEDGMQVEEEMVLTCLMSDQGMARRHVFFAIRRAQKPIHSLNPLSKHPLLKDNSRCAVGVIGAGTMGAGIAMVLLQTGYPKVYLVDVNQQALEKGAAFVSRTIQSLRKRRKLTPAKAQQMETALVSTGRLQDLKDCDLVVEAVVENMKIKQSIFQTLSRVTPRECLVLSNTSTLDIDRMANAFADDPTRQSTFAGWHFFSPAHVMPLVEIVVGARTSPETVGLLQALTKKIGKIGVVVGNCDGFCGNRMVRPYGAESVALLSEGAAASVEQVNGALTKFGMALGPLNMSDLAGNDVGYNIRRELGWVRDPQTGVVPKPRPARYTELADDLVAKLGRTGQKVGKGWSDYDPKVGRGFKPLPSPEVATFIQKYTRHSSSSPPKPLSSTQIVERVLFPLVNEGFKCLEENIAQRPSDIDVIYIFGYGFPPWRGGPMYWADNHVGLENLLKGLQRFSEQFPQTEHYVPSTLLEECVRLGLTVEEYYQKGLQGRKTSKL